MKKLFILSLLICIFLSGCTANKTEQSSLETSPGVTNETSSGVTNETSSGVTNDSSPNQGGDSMPYEHIAFYSEKTEDFVAWIKSEGKLNVGLNGETEYQANQAFLKWAKKQTEIPVPVSNKGYQVHAVSVLPSTKHDTAYMVLFDAPNKELVPAKAAMIDFTMIPLSDEELQSGLETIVREYLLNSPSIELKSKGMDSKFGEYWYTDYKENKDGSISTLAYFIVSNCLVRVYAYDGQEQAPWNPEIFEYFDFETVPLK